MVNAIPHAKALLNLVRSGWLLRGVPRFLAETVAEHTFLTAYICIELSSRIQDVDVGKAVLYSLIHDIGEAFMGDITKIVSERLGGLKKRMEEDLVTKNIDNKLIVKLYKKYMSQRDFEARLVKLCDRISMLLMAMKYKRLGYKVDDIVENVYKEVEEMSKSLGVEDKVKSLLRELEDL